MDRGAWQATVRGVTDIDMTEQLTHTYTHTHTHTHTHTIWNFPQDLHVPTCKYRRERRMQGQ